ncbi:MAG: AsmA-like C-terminal region-containing protein [bacterium]|nr:AsmA-like C-terminal region-containing protein [bacterium]
MKKTLMIIITTLILLMVGGHFCLQTSKIQKIVEKKIEKIIKHEIEFLNLDISLKGICIANLIVYREGKVFFTAKKSYLKFGIIELDGLEYALTDTIKLYDTNVKIKNNNHLKLETTINTYFLLAEANFSFESLEFDITKLKVSTTGITAVNTTVGKLKILDNNDFDLEIGLKLVCKDLSKYSPYLSGPGRTDCNLRMQSIDKITLDGIADFKSTEVIYGKLKKDMGVGCTLDYRIFYTKSPFKINIDSAVLKILNEDITMSGYFTKTTHSFNIQVNDLKAETLTTLIIDKFWKLNKGKLDIDAYLIKKYDLNTNSIVLIADLLDFDIFGAKFSEVFGTVALSGKDFVVKNLSGFINGGHFDFVADKKRYKLSLELLDMATKNLKAYGLFFYPLTLKKSGIRGQLIFDKIIYETLVFDNVKTNLLTDSHFLYFNGLKVDFNKGFLSGNARLDLDTKIYNADISLKNIFLDGIAEVFRLKYNVTGKANGSFTILSKLASPKIMDFKGTVELLTKDGQFQNIKIFNKFAENFNKKNLSTIHYDATFLKAKFDKGVLDIFEFKNKTKELGNIDLKGKLGFIDKSLDLKLDFEVNKFNPLVKSLVIKGTFSKPKYRLVLADIVKNLGETIVTLGPKVVKELVDRVT